MMPLDLARPLRRLLVTLALIACATPAHAGDPCPIDFAFHDLGAPSWLDRNALLTGLTSRDSWAGMSFSTDGDRVRIDAVSAGSPAAESRFRVGQRITTVDGARVETHQALARILRATPPGQTLAIGLADNTSTSLALGRQDPVLGALIDYASRLECTHVRRADLTPARVTELHGKVFHKNRRFRCDDAHKALAGTLEAGDIVMVRGSKRILLANPGWATVCVRAADVDGAKLEAGVKRLFETIAKRYVDDRYANP